MNFYISKFGKRIMKPRHLEKTDTGYKVYLYIFYVCGFIMASSLVFGVYVTMLNGLKMELM